MQRNLNLMPPPSSAALPEDSVDLDLKLAVAFPSNAAASVRCQSIYPLEMVQLALKQEQAKRETRAKQVRLNGLCLSLFLSTTSLSIKRINGGDDGEEGEEGAYGSQSSGGYWGMMSAECPRCQFYVLICKSDPRCPRCYCPVPVLAL